MIGRIRTRNICEHLRSLELRDTEEHLHSGAEVAAVAQVSEACVPWTIDCLQLKAWFLNHLPLSGSRLHMIVCVVAILCLVEKGRDVWSESNYPTISEWISKNTPFASLACLFRSVSSVLLCEGQVLPLLHRRSKHLFKKKEKEKDSIEPVVVLINTCSEQANSISWCRMKWLVTQ